MNRLTFILLVIVNLGFLGSCGDRDDELQNECVQISQNPDYNTGDFKNYFTIQFPDNYEGFGMTRFEGNTFRKFRKDEKIEFKYRFCGPTFCQDFGWPPFEEPIPNSMTAKDKSRNETILTVKKEFCSGRDVIGYFYFDNEADATGKYYMKIDSVYLEALTVYFDQSEYQEVENIIKTITEK